MAIQFWKDMSILEGSLELAGHGKNISITVDCAPLDTTALNNTSGYVDSDRRAQDGNRVVEFMQDVADDSLDEVLFANFGTVDVVRSFCTASAAGSVAFLMKGIELEYTPLQGNVGDLAMGTMKSMPSTGPLARGALLHPSKRFADIIFNWHREPVGRRRRREADVRRPARLVVLWFIADARREGAVRRQLGLHQCDGSHHVRAGGRQDV
jgi:hypothetical protein